MLSSLVDKGGSKDHMIQMQRLFSARIYLRYSEANETIKNTQVDYINLFHKELAALSVPVQQFVWDDEKVDRFYVGHYESEFLDFSRDSIIDLQQMLGEP